MVALKEAWRSGAHAWSQEAWTEFANDDSNLHVTSSGSNRNKHGLDPSDWRPCRLEHWPRYARDWIGIKAKWNLSINIEEKQALREMLNRGL